MTKRLYDAAKEVLASWEHGDLAGAVRKLDAAVNDPDLLATPEELDRARAIHGSDEVEIDEGALTSRCEEENGLWVSAWVWVPLPEPEPKPKPEPEYGKGVLNEYTCPACGREWESEWDCVCVDDCPSSGLRAISPDGDGS